MRADKLCSDDSAREGRQHVIQDVQIRPPSWIDFIFDCAKWTATGMLASFCLGVIVRAISWAFWSGWALF